MPFPYCVLGEQGRADPVDQTSDLLVTRNFTMPYIKFRSFQGGGFQVGFKGMEVGSGSLIVKIEK